MATLLEMAVELVSAHACNTTMTKDELIAEIASVYQALAALEKGEATITEGSEGEDVKPVISAKKSIGKNAITCLICGKKHEDPGPPPENGARLEARAISQAVRHPPQPVACGEKLFRVPSADGHRPWPG